MNGPGRIPAQRADYGVASLSPKSVLALLKHEVTEGKEKCTKYLRGSDLCVKAPTGATRFSFQILRALSLYELVRITHCPNVVALSNAQAPRYEDERVRCVLCRHSGGRPAALQGADETRMTSRTSFAVHFVMLGFHCTRLTDLLAASFEARARRSAQCQVIINYI
ncbi:hypothetical protein HPB47_006770 [Ixodes persulcatus]|uniref:Uncharacterized protein n=1 Tax=Ixodes persulcatus TaxID=34615 RepID=A0AC60PAC3_IXOPE|nr:hypothetical protein HPB47_006770 [Ixodes persulcatus]